MIWRIACGAIALGLLAAPVRAQTTADDEKFFQRGREGWYWYHDPPPPDSSPPPAPASPPPAPSPATPEVAAAAAGPPVMSAAWFRDRLPAYRDAAIDNPTPSNVERYLVLQHIMMDRASRFTDMFQRVVVSSPYLDANTQRPLDSVAANALNDIANAASEALLRQVAQTSGLVFFFRSDCALCAMQFDVLEMAQRLYGFTVLYVSLDGRPMPDMPRVSWAPNVGQAERMGVTAAPSLALLHPPDRFVLLSQSVLSLPSMMERVLLQARGAGLITEAQYAATKPVREVSLLGDAGALSGLSDDVIDDPDRFLAVIHSLQGAHP
jgi:conjugal transfer pilus assembly protein TraF